jgi:exopolysaccharide biosynthesis protein
MIKMIKRKEGNSPGICNYFEAAIPLSIFDGEGSGVRCKLLKYFSFLFILSISTLIANAQLKWANVDSLYHPLPKSIHVFKTTESLDGKPNIAFYVIADLKDKNILFDADTTYKRRLTPFQFFQKNNQPLVVVNCTFFSFQTNQNLNVVIKDGKILSHNLKTLDRKTGDSIRKVKLFRSAIGINKNRKADVAWIRTDSSKKYAAASQSPPVQGVWWSQNSRGETKRYEANDFNRWNVETAVGGGPVLIQNGKINISNEHEFMFTGNAINDKHPRTAMGYTRDDKLIILVIQGRFPGKAEGATLVQEAQILKDLGCREALNLDGGGSSCMLINGKETIKPSDTTGQRPIPAVFLIRRR